MYVDQRLGDFLAHVGDRTPAPGAGVVAAVTVSLSANLVAMAARYAVGRPAGSESVVAEAVALGRRAEALADQDAAAYAAVLAARTGGQEPDTVAAALQHAAEVALEVAETAAEVARLAVVVFAGGVHDLRGEAATALLLAEGATRAAAYLVEIDVLAGGGGRELVDRARACIARATSARDVATRRVPVPVDH